VSFFFCVPLFYTQILYIERDIFYEAEKKVPKLNSTQTEGGDLGKKFTCFSNFWKTKANEVNSKS